MCLDFEEDLVLILLPKVDQSGSQPLMSGSSCIWLFGLDPSLNDLQLFGNFDKSLWNLLLDIEENFVSIGPLEVGQNESKLPIFGRPWLDSFEQGLACSLNYKYGTQEREKKLVDGGIRTQPRLY